MPTVNVALKDLTPRSPSGPGRGGPYRVPVLALIVTLMQVQPALCQTELPAFKPAPTSYMIYGGGLGNPAAAAGVDQKMAFVVEGKPARQMFNAMGPDLKNTCGDGRVRIRERDGGRLSCVHYPKEGYTCHFGFDLATGKSIGGVIC